jgi:HSP90 family molecular chaperone
LDDTGYDESDRAEVTFKLQRQKLTVESNQIGFTEADVKAICDMGKSSKVPGSEGIKDTIGEKGIGFFNSSVIANRRIPVRFCSSRSSPDIFEWIQFRIRSEETTWHSLSDNS